MTKQEMIDLRTALKLNQRQLAEMLGVSRYHIIDAEKRDGPSPMMAFALERFQLLVEVENLKENVSALQEKVRGLERANELLSTKPKVNQLVNDLLRAEATIESQKRSIELLTAARKAAQAKSH